MAISPQKLAANQENARRSTGPRTPQGKAKVRFNAVKHGLLAQEVIVPVGDEQEKRAEFELRVSAHRDQPDRSIVITRIGRS